MKLITSAKTSVLIYAGEKPIMKFYMIKGRPDVYTGDILVVDKAQANTIVYSNIGFEETSAQSIEELYEQSKELVQEVETEEA